MSSFVEKLAFELGISTKNKPEVKLEEEVLTAVLKLRRQAHYASELLNLHREELRNAEPNGSKG